LRYTTAEAKGFKMYISKEGNTYYFSGGAKFLPCHCFSMKEALDRVSMLAKRYDPDFKFESTPTFQAISKSTWSKLSNFILRNKEKGFLEFTLDAPMA